MGKVICEKNDGIAVVSINRPEKLNALNDEIFDEIENIFDGLAADGGLMAVIVGGTENFAAGVDIQGMVENNPEQSLVAARRFNRCFNKIMNLPVPVIAAIDGYALGGGLELALACDMRIATESAQVGFPEINLGIMPGAGGTIRLPRLVGYAKACELILTGDRINAQDAEKIGLVNMIVPKEELLPTAQKWCQKFAKKGRASLITAKRTIAKGLSIPVTEEAVEYEASEWAKLFSTEDQKEGMRAFVEKRKPSFTGK